MCSSCPIQPNFRCSFFFSEFSTGRKVAAGASIAIGVALAVIFALGVAGILPAVNAQIPILLLTFGTVGFLGGGIALAGIKPPKSDIENFTGVLSGLANAAGTAAEILSNEGEDPPSKADHEKQS